eukprot:GDKH01013511.1.p1 GENE.GDKH01013511.1~~GDKH01013511.1.p1  ORF type:complete len:105 (-),score=5.63 GDKH01013511.1:11-325(-)
MHMHVPPRPAPLDGPHDQVGPQQPVLRIKKTWARARSQITFSIENSEGFHIWASTELGKQLHVEATTAGESGVETDSWVGKEEDILTSQGQRTMVNRKNEKPMT